MSRNIPPNKMTKLRWRRPTDTKRILIFCSFCTKEFIIKIPYHRHTIFWEGQTQFWRTFPFFRWNLYINTSFIRFLFQLLDKSWCYDLSIVLYSDIISYLSPIPECIHIFLRNVSLYGCLNIESQECLYRLYFDDDVYFGYTFKI